MAYNCYLIYITIFVTLSLFYKTDGIPSKYFIAEFTSENKNKVYRECTDDFTKLDLETSMVSKVQKCCSYILECANAIKPEETRYGLRNEEDYPMLPCMCDFEFRHCLQSFPKKYRWLAGQIGRFYYNHEARVCYLKIYRDHCDRPFVDEDGASYEDNDEGRYFCPVLHDIPQY